MPVLRIDPIADGRWREFINTHPAASIFHTPEWLEALRRTYDFIPVACVLTNAEHRIVAGIPFCEVHSRLTGRRMVSLPFSDHCDPLVHDKNDLTALLAEAQQNVTKGRFKYVELRPLTMHPGESQPMAVVHRLHLARSWDQVRNGFHKNHVVRRHAHAQQQALLYEEGCSDALIRKFYELLLLTRRKHRLPPQPMAWFQNLSRSLGDRLKIRVLSKDGLPVASTITLSFKTVRTYKYSCSNPKFNSIAGTVLLIWRTIEDALNEGASELDLGRSDLDNPGLIAFKDHWGAAKSPLAYYRFPQRSGRKLHKSAIASFAKRLLVSIPDPVFSALGGLFYKHAA